VKRRDQSRTFPDSSLVHFHIFNLADQDQHTLAAAPDVIDPSVLDQLAAKLQQAESPVIIAGGGCRHFGELVVQVAERYACPVVTTVAGRGVIPGTHPLSVGAQTEVAEIQQFIQDSDFALLLGTELAEPDHWGAGLTLPASQSWINLDSDLLQSKKQALSLCADIGFVMAAMLSRLSAANQESTKRAYQRCKHVRDQLRGDFTPLQKAHWRVLTELKKVLPDDVCVFSDMTQLAYTAVAYMPLQRTNSWMHPNGYGTLGYALPAAIGAHFADSELPLLVIVGDAGFQYTFAEMALAAEYQINLVVVLWQNDGLQQIHDDMLDAAIEPLATRQPNPDFVALAQVYGWQATKVVGLFELGSVVSDAFTKPGPVLVEIAQSAA